MESAGMDFQVLPDTLLMSKSGYPTNRGEELSESTGNCLEEMSSNLPTYTQVSGMPQLSNGYPFSVNCDSVTKATAKCNSHQSNSGPTVKMCHLILWRHMPWQQISRMKVMAHATAMLSFGRKVLQYDVHKMKYYSNQHKRTDSIVPLRDIRIGLHDKIKE